jgi:hypothetical protein
MSTVSPGEGPWAVRLEEYKSLRAEILEADKLSHQTTVFTVLVVGGVLAFALSKVTEASQFVVAMASVGIATFAIWVGAHMVGVQRKRIWRIATYFSVILEPKLGVHGWESILAAFGEREAAARGDDGSSESTTAAILNDKRIFLYCLALCGVSALAFVVLGNWPQAAAGRAAALILACVIVPAAIFFYWDVNKLFERLERDGSIPKAYRKRWENLKDQSSNR